MQLTKANKERIGSFIERQFEIERDLIDIVAYWDSSLNYHENKQQIYNKLVELGYIANKEIDLVKLKEEEQEGIKLEEESVLREQVKAIEEVKQGESRKLIQAFSTMQGLLNGLMRSKDINGLIVEGEAGIGKTHMVIVNLNSFGYKLNEDYVLLSGYTTPLELYKYLYENRNKKVIVFDDVMKVLNNDVSKGIMLGALFNPSGRRFISYMSSSGKLDIPSVFEFNSKVIWLTNGLPKDVDNIKSRCFYYELRFGYNDKIILMYEIAKIKGIPFEIVDYIKEVADESYILDFRVLQKAYSLYLSDKDNWRILLNALLKADKDLIIVKQLLNEGLGMKDTIINFQEETGKSRATFFRYKKELKIKSQSRIN